MQMKRNRPILKTEATSLDRIIEGVSWLVLLSLWVVVILKYSDLPDIIPTHFNAVGEVDDYSRKWLIFSLPGVATILAGIFNFISKHPDRLNYPVVITQENALRQYTLAVRMLRYLKLGIILIFSAIGIESVLIGLKMAHAFKPWLLPVLLAMVFLPIIVYFFSATKNRH